MPLSRATLAIAFALALAASTAGCIENMGDLKETLGVKTPPPPPPVFLPPIAKAQANATSVLVGELVKFTSEGTKDAQQLPLDLTWHFDDGTTARGPVATHAFAAPGEHKARLVVTNTAGLSDDETLVVRVTPSDRAPTAALRITDATGVATLRGTMGAPLAFEAAASDPEGAPLAFEWGFGDGATSHDARAEHAYEAPGVYDVRLSVTDRAGNRVVETARVKIDAQWRAAGEFTAAGANVEEVPILVARETRELTLTLAFDAGLGVNDLELIILDAAGDEVARTDGSDAPGTQGEATRTLELDEFPAPGAWSVQVLRERGVSVPWTLEIAALV